MIEKRKGVVRTSTLVEQLSRRKDLHIGQVVEVETEAPNILDSIIDLYRGIRLRRQGTYSEGVHYVVEKRK